jgi:chemotaxis protein methyltransferase CheR
VKTSGAALDAGRGFDAAAALIRDRTGLVFGEHRRTLLSAGLEKAMRRAGIADVEAYVSQLSTDPLLLDNLVDDITIGETYFFREPEQFAFIKSTIAPELAEYHGEHRRLHVWSAGTASGEEAYTLAITFYEAGLLDRTSVIGTDICHTALARARRGRYREWSLRSASQSAIDRYFHREGNAFALVPTIRRAVEFRHLNLTEAPYPAWLAGGRGLDLILCRNVLLYFHPDVAAQVTHSLAAALDLGGWLVLGASDPVPHEIPGCEASMTPGGLAFRRVSRGLTHAAPRPTPAIAFPVELPPAPSVERAAPAIEPVREMVDRPIEDAAPWVQRIRALSNDGRLDEAVAVCVEALDLYPTNAELMYLHAVVLAERGAISSAVAAIRRALYLDRQLIVAHVLLGVLLVRVGDHAAAGRALRNALRMLTPMNADDPIPASDGMVAAQFAGLVRAQLELLAQP